MKSSTYVFAATQGFFAPENTVESIIKECQTSADLENLAKGTLLEAVLLENPNLQFPSLKQCLISFARNGNGQPWFIPTLQNQIMSKAFNGLLRQVKVLQDKRRGEVFELQQGSKQNKVNDEAQDKNDIAFKEALEQMEENAAASIERIEKNFEDKLNAFKKAVAIQNEALSKLIHNRVLKTDAPKKETKTTAAKKANAESKK